MGRLGHRRDPQHEAVLGLYRELRSKGGPVCTSDYVLAETITLLYRREDFEEATRFVEGIIESAVTGFLRIEHVTPERFAAAWELRKRYHDKPRMDCTPWIGLKQKGLLKDEIKSDEKISR